jgi:hypothetical protein
MIKAFGFDSAKVTKDKVVAKEVKKSEDANKTNLQKMSDKSLEEKSKPVSQANNVAQ